MNKLQKIKGFLWIRLAVFRNKNLNGSDIMVYAALMSHMNNETKECFPSIKLLMAEARLTQKTVFKSLDKLENEKLIYIRREKGKINHYVMLEPPME